jgi:hypothetical protein
MNGEVFHTPTPVANQAAQNEALRFRGGTMPGKQSGGFHIYRQGADLLAPMAGMEIGLALIPK